MPGPLVAVIGLPLVALVARGAVVDPGITERVSVASDGTQANDYRDLPAISGDGRCATTPTAWKC